MKFCLDITTRKGCAWNNIKKPSRETVQCIVRQSEFLEKSLGTRLRITTGGSHKIRLSRDHVWSTGPGGPIPVYLWWRYKLSCQSNWEVLDNMRLRVQWAGIWKRLDSNQKITWDLCLKMEHTQSRRKTYCSDCYRTWQMNRQVSFELKIWVEKWIALDLEDMETVGQEQG